MRKGVALLVTVFFVMAITLSIGIGFRYINHLKDSVTDEQYMLQVNAIIEDFVKILDNSKLLKDINDADDLNIFLEQSSFIPLEYQDIKITIEFSNARDKININSFKDKKRFELFKKYLISKNIDTEYAYLILDSISGIKKDASYNTDIFYRYPTLFRDYITSDEHLEKINQIYKNKYHDNNVKNIDMKNLFYINKDTKTNIDLNFATIQVWQYILGCTKQRAIQLYSNKGNYKEINNLNLTDEEKTMLNRFNYSFFEPYVDVKVEISQKNKIAYITFQYEFDKQILSNLNIYFK